MRAQNCMKAKLSAMIGRVSENVSFRKVRVVGSQSNTVGEDEPFKGCNSRTFVYFAHLRTSRLSKSKEGLLDGKDQSSRAVIHAF